MSYRTTVLLSAGLILLIGFCLQVYSIEVFEDFGFRSDVGGGKHELASVISLPASEIISDDLCNLHGLYFARSLTHCDVMWLLVINMPFYFFLGLIVGFFTAEMRYGIYSKQSKFKFNLRSFWELVLNNLAILLLLIAAEGILLLLGVRRFEVSEALAPYLFALIIIGYISFVIGRSTALSRRTHRFVYVVSSMTTLVSIPILIFDALGYLPWWIYALAVLAMVGVFALCEAYCRVKRVRKMSLKSLLKL